MSAVEDLFKIWKENLDLNEFKDFINSNSSRLILSFKDLFDWIEVNSLLEKLWGAINQIEQKYYEWEVLLIHLIKGVLTPILLNKIGRLNDNILQISRNWFEYLINRTAPYLSELPDKFCSSLYTNAPVSDKPAYEAQIIRLGRIYVEKSLMDTYDSDESDILGIIDAFEQNFGNHYPIFHSRCKYLGDEWGKHEGKIYGNDLSLIFQLRNNNDRTLPDIVKDTLIELIHIRNAPAHKDTCGIIPVDENRVRIRDRKSDGTLTYDETILKEDLWKYFYKLIVLDEGLNLFALYLDLYFKLREHDQSFVIILNCSCGEVSKVYFPQHISQIVCNGCQKIHTRDKLKLNGIIEIEKE